jgi:hypothetical protein
MEKVMIDPNVVDAINSGFAFVGSFFVMANIRTMLKDKELKGSYWLTPLFFYCGQIWGAYFMWTMEKYWSLAGAIVLTSLNLTWYGIMIYYRIKGKNDG